MNYQKDPLEPMKKVIKELGEFEKEYQKNHPEVFMPIRFKRSDKDNLNPDKTKNP